MLGCCYGCSWKYVCDTGPAMQAWQGSSHVSDAPGPWEAQRAVVEEISHSLGSLGQGQGEALGGSVLSWSFSTFCVDQHPCSGCEQCILYGNHFLFKQNDILIARGGRTARGVLSCLQSFVQRGAIL